jgi:hypothetical protein
MPWFSWLTLRQRPGGEQREPPDRCTAKLDVTPTVHSSVKLGSEESSELGRVIEQVYDCGHIEGFAEIFAKVRTIASSSPPW